MSDFASMLPLAWAVTPWFFGAGLALASIPIIIHLLNRRRFKTVQWAAMEYLLQALRKNRRRIKFEQIVLLATRCAVLGLLGLALARPLGCGGNSMAALAGNRSALHVFVIDNSYSMAYEADRPDAKTHLDQARKLVKDQLSRLVPGGESVAIVAAARPRTSPDGAPASHVVLRPGFDLQAARSAVERVEQSYNGTDITGALMAALQIAREETKQPQKYLYILSDNTRSAWENPQHAEALKQIGVDLEGAFGRGHVRLNDLSRPNQWNHAVLDVRPDGQLVTTALHTDFLADVKGFGPGSESFIQWKWDDRVLGDTARLTPDASTRLQRNTKIRTDRGGPHVLAATLVNDERLKIDNIRQRVVQVASELKVLIVEGERGESLLSGSGAFLDLALAPKRDVGPDGRARSDSYVSPELISDLEFGNKVLADYRAVILANVASLNPNQADQVQKFVQGGGTFMVFLGEQVSTDAYNSVLLSRNLMPGKLIARKVAPDPSTPYTLDFNPNNPGHPILDVFRGNPATGLNTARILTYYQMELAPDTKAEPVLKYVHNDKPTGDPAITVHRLGKGRVAVVTTTANGEWQTLVAKPSWVALVHELLAGTVDVGDRWMNLLVGQPLEVPSSLKLTSPPALTDAAKKQHPVEAMTGRDGQTVYRSKPLDKPGIYQLNVGTMVVPIAVNVPADEADIRPAASEAIKKALGNIDLQTYGDVVPDEALSRDDVNDLGWSVMLIVLALVGLECFLAMLFGHYRRSTVVRGPVPAT